MLQIDLISTLLLLGIGQGVFLTVTLLLRAENQRQANRFLALYILTTTLTLVEQFILYSELELQYPTIAYLLWPVVFLMGPCLWWYLRSLLEQGFQFGRNQLPHLISSLLSLGAMLPFYLLPAAIKRPQLLPTATEADYTWHVIGVDLVFYAMMIQLGFYTIAFASYIRNYREQRQHTFSTEARLLFNWLAVLCAMYALCWILFMLSAFVAPFGDIFWILMALSMSILMFIVVYFAMRRPILFEESEIALPAIAEQPIVETPAPLTGVPSPSDQTIAYKKYFSSSLSVEQAVYIRHRLLNLMEAEQPYLDRTLTLPQLAGRLNVSSNHLSQVINEQLTSNFFDFVNRYRVEDAKRLLLTNPSYTVMDIALDAGFNSKSAFYKSFRQHVAMTPSQFRKTGVRSAESTSQIPS